MDDKIRKKRHSFGDKSPTAILSEAQVYEVAALMKTSTPRKKIAQLYGVSVSALYRITCGYSWKHLGLTERANG